MIDFSAANLQGKWKSEFTNIGQGYVITAAHMFDNDESKAVARKHAVINFGGVESIAVDASNNFENWSSYGKKDNNDFAVLKMSKFNLNMNAEINPNFNFMSNTGSRSVDIDKYQDNFWTSCQDGSCDYSIGKGQLFNSNRYTYFVCEGSGVQKLSFKDSSQFVATIADNDKFHTDGFNTLDKLQTTSSRFSIKFRNESIVGDFKFERNDFVSSSAPGDSTSAIYVYDSVEKQWYVIGVVSTSDCTASDLTGYPCVQENYALLNNAKIDEFKQSHTTLLNGGNYALSDNGLKDSANKDMGASVIVGNAKGAITFANYYNKGNFNNQNNAMQNSKDLYLQGNGTSSKRQGFA